MGMSIMNRRRFLKPAEEAGVVLNLLSPVCMENAMLNRPLRKTVSMLFLASVFMAAPLHAEADPGGPVKAAEETSRKANNLGFAVGYLSGYGFSYRHWFPSKNGYQLTFLPMAFFSDESAFFNTSLGVLGLRSFYQTGRSNFFGYYGGHYNFNYIRTREVNDSFTPVKRYSNKQQGHSLLAGAGMGFEVHFWILNYSLMLGYAANLRTERVDDPFLHVKTQTPYPYAGQWKDSFILQPSIESALFYAF